MDVKTLANGQRYYRRSKRSAWVPSVTTVLDALREKRLEEWYEKQQILEVLSYSHPDKGEKAKMSIFANALIGYAKENVDAQTGIMVHKYIFHDPKDVPKLSKDAERALESWRYVRELLGDFKVLLYEKSFVGPRWGGTPDLIIEIDGDAIMIDFKTSKDIKPSMAAQVAAYGKLVRPSGIIIKRGFVIRLGKWNSENFEIKPVDLENGYKLFLAAYNWWKFNNMNQVYLS